MWSVIVVIVVIIVVIVVVIVVIVVIWGGSGWIWDGSGSILGGSGVDLLFGVDFPLAAQNCERIPKTRVSRFLAFYPLISAFQALPYI